MSVIVQYSDYDEHTLIGIFPTMDEAYDYCKKNDLKPQYYDWSTQINNFTFEFIFDVERWCGWTKCSKTEISFIDGKDHWSGKFCSTHLPMEKKKREEEILRIYKMEQEWEKGQPEREEAERKSQAEFWKNVQFSGSVGTGLSSMNMDGISLMDDEMMKRA